MAQERDKQNVIGYFNTRFPEFADEGEIVRLIEMLSSRSGILVTGINFSEMESSRDLAVVFDVSGKVQARSVNISAQGSVANIQEFIEGVESRRRIFNIRSLTVNQDQPRTLADQDNPNRYALSLRTEVYFWDQSIEELAR